MQKGQEKFFWPSLVLEQLFQRNTYTLDYQLREIIFTLTKKVIGEGKINFDEVEIEHPQNENYGDYSTNIALILGARMKTRPFELAKTLVEELNKYILRYQSISKKTYSFSLQDKKVQGKHFKKSEKIIGKILEKAEVAGPGFINLWLRKEYLITYLKRLLKNKKPFGITQIGQGKKILVEHTSPNTNKPLHIGHVRNNILGMSLVSLFKTLGFETFSVQIINDRGAHICQSLWGYLFFGQRPTNQSCGKKLAEEEKSWQNLLTKWYKEPNRWLAPSDLKLKPDSFVGHFYVLAEKEKEKNQLVEKEIEEMLLAWERGEEKIRSLWQKLNQWFYEGSRITYQRLGSYIDKNWYESQIYQKGKELVLKNLRSGLFEKKEDGSIKIGLGQFGLPEKVVIRADGTSLYITQDLALLKLRLGEEKPDFMIYVVSNEQTLHFRQLFAIAKLLKLGKKENWYHLAYGSVRLPSGAMSSRLGKVVLADDFLDEMEKKVEKKMQEVKFGLITGEIDLKEKKEIVKKVALAAVKYAILRINPLLDMIFDIDKSIAIKGDSGPYLLYTYARCQSVLRKAKMKNLESEIFRLEAGKVRGETIKPNSEEFALLRAFCRFPEIILQAAKTLSPNFICGYLYDLAQKYNLFYHKHPILRPAASDMSAIGSFRLFLTAATAEIIKQGLFSLGIETTERM